MKKVIVFGGGTGLSCLLSGLKLFPVEVTTVITVSDNGSSTGVLKQEFDIPAVGDVGKVLLSMANVDEDFVKLLRYRFRKAGSSLDNHPVRNILLTALIDLKGNLTEATRYMSKLLRIKGEVLPLSEERVELVGKDEMGNPEYYGEDFPTITTSMSETVCGRRSRTRISSSSVREAFTPASFRTLSWRISWKRSGSPRRPSCTSRTW